MKVIIADDIINECCNMALLYTDTDYTSKQILKSSPNLSSDQAETISLDIKSYINQGIMFLKDSDENVFTSPLTLFYSLNNFTKAIFLLHEPNSTLSESHGLTLEREKIKEDTNLSDVRVSVKKNGTFCDLLKITKDEINLGDSFDLKNILSVIPEIIETFANRYHEEPNVFLLQEESQTTYKLMIHNVQDDEIIRKRDFSYPYNYGCHLNIVGNNSSMWIDERYIPDRKCILYDVYGNNYCSCGFEHNGKMMGISKITGLYMCYYTFSMLVRYYPETWSKICNSADIAIIRKLLIHCRKDMLAEVVRLLFDELYYFSTKIETKNIELDYDKIFEEIKDRERTERYRSGGR